MNTEQTTPSNKGPASPEEVDRWIEHFRDYCEAQKIAIEGEDHQIFIALERAYWLGIVEARGAEAIPAELAIMLFAQRSPLLDYKSPVKKRIRRTKAEIEAAQAANLPVVDPDNPFSEKE